MLVELTGPYEKRKEYGSPIKALGRVVVAEELTREEAHELR